MKIKSTIIEESKNNSLKNEQKITFSGTFEISCSICCSSSKWGLPSGLYLYLWSSLWVSRVGTSVGYNFYWPRPIKAITWISINDKNIRVKLNVITGSMAMNTDFLATTVSWMQWINVMGKVRIVLVTNEFP